MIKVSIIIPAYNIEKYIGRCLDSCINQTFRDIEIIVVNDGSTDNTLSVIQAYSKNDNRIKIVDKKNSGSSEARLSGFEISRGEYVLFIDGDDWIDNRTIEILNNKVEEYKYDIVIYKYLLKYDDGKEEKVLSYKDIDDNGHDLLNLLFTCKVPISIWSKFIRRNFIIENNIEFPKKISCGEDLAFVCTLAMYKPKFSILDDYLYYYYQRYGSLDNEINNKSIEITEATKFVKNNLIRKNLYDEYKEAFEYVAFIANYYNKKEYILQNNNKLSYILHKNWKSLNINLNCKNNNFYKNIYGNDCRKAQILAKLCERSYIIGKVYYNFFQKHINKKKGHL